MADGYTRQAEANITAGSTARAADVNAEYDQLAAAFDGTTGHTHDGTTGMGPKIDLAGSVSGTLPIANGGTGGTTASAARTALGLAIGTNVQAYDADLTALGGLAKTDGNFIVGDGTTWVVESGSTARTSLGLGSVATESTLPVAKGGTGATDAATARTNLGLGSLATASTINNSNWSGTDLAVTNGGTGASDAATARTNLGLAIGTNVQAYDADTLKSDTSANLTAGFTTTGYNAGTQSSGTFTPSAANGNLQYTVNGGAHTLAPMSSDGTLIIQYTNSGSAGTITTSGFTKVSGSFTTTNGDDFLCYLTKLNGFSHLNIVRLQ